MKIQTLQQDVNYVREQMVLMQESQKEFFDLLKDPAKLLEALKRN
jgi:hypothetical protein